MNRLWKLLLVTITIFLAMNTMGFAAAFTDTANHWGRQAIELMSSKEIVNGYTDGTFKPNAEIRRVEVIIMLVRALGLEDEARNLTTIPSSFNNPDSVPAWGRGYVSVAVSEGIIAGEDLQNFRPLDGAKRFEVATFVTRAMGWTDEAQSLSLRPLNFTDANQIPPLARGYVAVMVEYGIMEGDPSGTFRPHSTIRRAEMATMLARVDKERVLGESSRDVRGVISAVSGNSVSVRKESGATFVIDLASGASIYNENGQASVSSLGPGQRVRAVLGSDGKGVYIEVLDNRRIVIGKITSVSSGLSPVVTVKDSSGTSEAYVISQDVSIKVDGQVATISDLKVGQSVELELSGNLAVVIRAQNPLEEISGIVQNIVLGSYSFIVIDTDDGNKTFRLAYEVEVEKDGENVDINRVESGDRVVAEVKGDFIYSISAETMDRDLVGEIIGLVFRDTPVLTLRTEAGTEYEYPVADDVDVEVDNRTRNMSYLKIGQEAEVKVRGGEVTEVIAENVEKDLIGTVDSISITQTGATISLVTEGGEVESYQVDPDAVITDGTRSIDIGTVKPGSQVEAHVMGKSITRLEASLVSSSEEIRGYIAYINDQVDVITVVSKIGGDDYKLISLKDVTTIVRKGRLADIDDLRVNDQVLVLGKTEMGLFTAETVLVTQVAP